MRIRLDLAYDGTDFSGWAAQPGLRTVEGEVSAALTTVVRAPEPVRLVVAGRTDAGVHARGQVAHADLDPAAYAAVPGRSDRSPAAALATRLRGVLPADVVVRSVREAPAGFDARFSAIWRRYSYRLCDDPAALDPVRRRDTVVVRDRLDADAMTAAASTLLGLGDFAPFCKKREGATTIRELLEFEVERRPDEAGTIECRLRADAFCHSMVRAIVGPLLAVGEGRREPEWVAQVLGARSHDAMAVAPPHGLTLEEVGYPADADLAARAAQARARRDQSSSSSSSNTNSPESSSRSASSSSPSSSPSFSTSEVKAE